MILLESDLPILRQPFALFTKMVSRQIRVFFLSTPIFIKMYHVDLTGAKNIKMISCPCLQIFDLLALWASKSIIYLSELKFTRPKEKKQKL